MPTPEPVSLLILGAGWTSTFLIPLLKEQGIHYAATTRNGRDDTLKFTFNPDSTSPEPYQILPVAEAILITFPLVGPGQSTLLLRLYAATHPGVDPHYIQLGSTGIWDIATNQQLQPANPQASQPQSSQPWKSRHSEYNKADPRAIAEDELRLLGGCVLNLSGLWGGARQPRHWIERVAATKDQLAGKSSLHMIHGEDVARAVVAVAFAEKSFRSGQRWMLTDLMVYDWWALILGWAGKGEKQTRKSSEDEEKKALLRLQWTRELMAEKDVKALPRSPQQLGRCYDSREFWETFKIMPGRAGLM